MGSKVVQVLFSSNKNNFAALPPFWTQQFSFTVTDNQIFVVEIKYGDEQAAFLSWSGDVSRVSPGQLDSIEVNGLFANKLGINHGQEVMIQHVPNVASCTRVYVEPLSVDDWEIMELHASSIEANLLNQVRVVWQGQTLPIWVDGKICVFVSISTIEPASICAVLEQLTEVVIAPKERKGRRKEVKSGKEKNKDSGKKQRLNKPDKKESNGPKQKRSDLSEAVFPEQQPKSPATMNKQEMKSSSDDKEHGMTNEQHTIDDNAKENKPEELKNGRSQETCTRSNNNPLFDQVTGAFNFMKFMFYGPDFSGDKLDPSNVVKTQMVSEISSTKFEFLVRLQPLQMDLESDVWFSKFSQQHTKQEELSDATEMSSTKSLKNFIMQQPTIVYVSAKTLISSSHCDVNEIPSSFLATLKKIPSPNERHELSKKRDRERKGRKTEKQGEEDQSLSDCDAADIIVRVIVTDLNKIGADTSLCDENTNLPCVLEGHVLVPDLLRRQCSFGATSVLNLKSVLHDDSQCNGIELLPLFPKEKHITKDIIQTAWRVWLSQCTSVRYPLIASHHILIRIPLFKDFTGDFLLKVDQHTKDKTTKLPYVKLHPGNTSEIEPRISEQITPKNKPEWLKELPPWTSQEIDPPVPRIRLTELGGVLKQAEAALEFLTCTLAQTPLTKQLFNNQAILISGCLLVCGCRGSGKTSLAKALCSELTAPPNLAYVSVVECRSLRGKRVDAIVNILQKVFSEAAWREPSVILLDDLDHVTSAPAGPEQEMSGEMNYYTKVAEVLKDILMAEICNNSKVVVIATSKSPTSVHQSLIASRGTHLFQQTVEITPPDKGQRVDILKALLYKQTSVAMQSVQNVNISSIASKTEGYMARDLELIVSRAVHAHLMTSRKQGSRRHKSKELLLTDQDFNIALNGFTPASLWNVPLHTGGELGWQDVGGLHTVRKTLVETLQWPSKYPELFSNCPLRLRCGLLLYGAPGTGKTLLAGVVAKECGLNFISIKGPELLSKYIGASEQAVRDTFTRAQSAKPCILFFDEFDALAPRRGHDSTGVTDRVVNQLLTQLDGVEGLEGVYVLAATSRPDLIDPALLRPGRLDKCLCCDLPSKDERQEILVALCKDMNLASDVDLTVIAKQCQHFTGADFKALLYNAQLEAIHERTSHLREKIKTNEREVPNAKETLKNMVESVLHNEETSDGSHGTTGASIPEQTAVVMAKPRKPASERGVSFMPNLTEGVVEISAEREQQLLSEIDTMKLNASEDAIGVKNNSSSRDPKSTSSLSTEINQSHLLKAAGMMKPSVDEKERRKYRHIYDNFVSSRGGNFGETELTAGKRLTLA